MIGCTLVTCRNGEFWTFIFGIMNFVCWEIVLIWFVAGFVV